MYNLQDFDYHNIIKSHVCMRMRMCVKAKMWKCKLPKKTQVFKFKNDNWQHQKMMKMKNTQKLSRNSI